MHDIDGKCSEGEAKGVFLLCSIGIVEAIYYTIYYCTILYLFYCLSNGEVRQSELTGVTSEIKWTEWSHLAPSEPAKEVFDF